MSIVDKRLEKELPNENSINPTDLLSSFNPIDILKGEVKTKQDAFSFINDSTSYNAKSNIIHIVARQF